MPKYGNVCIPTPDVFRLLQSNNKKKGWVELRSRTEALSVVEEILRDGKMRSKRLATDLDVKQNIR